MSLTDRALSARATRSRTGDGATKDKVITKKRISRCKKCKNCLKLNCKKCEACKDMEKNGGPNKLKKACFMREQCLKLTPHEKYEKQEVRVKLAGGTIIEDKIPKADKRKPGRPKKSKNQTEAAEIKTGGPGLGGPPGGQGGICTARVDTSKVIVSNEDTGRVSQVQAWGSEAVQSQYTVPNSNSDEAELVQSSSDGDLEDRPRKSAKRSPVKQPQSAKEKWMSSFSKGRASNDAHHVKTVRTWGTMSRKSMPEKVIDKEKLVQGDAKPDNSTESICNMLRDIPQVEDSRKENEQSERCGSSIGSILILEQGDNSGLAEPNRYQGAGFGIDLSGELWVETKTVGGKSFYYNANTRETLWTVPQGEDVKILSPKSSFLTPDEVEVLRKKIQARLQSGGASNELTKSSQEPIKESDANQEVAIDNVVEVCADNEMIPQSSIDQDEEAEKKVDADPPLIIENKESDDEQMKQLEISRDDCLKKIEDLESERRDLQQRELLLSPEKERNKLNKSLEMEDAAQALEDELEDGEIADSDKEEGKNNGDKAGEDLHEEKRPEEDHDRACDWKEHTSGSVCSGKKYYFNWKTQESVWEKPQELKDYESRVAEYQQVQNEQDNDQGHEVQPPRQQGNDPPPHQQEDGRPVHQQADGPPPHQQGSGPPTHQQEDGRPVHQQADGLVFPGHPNSDNKIEIEFKIKMTPDQFVDVIQRAPGFIAAIRSRQ